MNNLPLIIVIALFQAIFLGIGYYLGKQSVAYLIDNVKMTKKDKRNVFEKVKDYIKHEDAVITSPSAKENERRLIDDLTK